MLVPISSNPLFVKLNAILFPLSLINVDCMAVVKLPHGLPPQKCSCLTHRALNGVSIGDYVLSSGQPLTSITIPNGNSIGVIAELAPSNADAPICVASVIITSVKVLANNNHWHSSYQYRL